MIEWHKVVSNSLWILGLSVLLAALSYQRWKALENNLKFRDQLSTKGWRFSIAVGIVLVLGGLGLTATALWEKFFWSLLSLVYIAKTISWTKSNFIRKN
jgi:uncharacterized membrane protein YidH (DUF202 family)